MFSGLLNERRDICLEPELTSKSVRYLTVEPHLVLVFKRLALTGTLPQNVNYAVKSSFILALLESVPGLATRRDMEKVARGDKFEDLVAEAQKACALVLVY